MQARVIASQKAILDDLLTLRPRHLFCEGQSKDWHAMDKADWRTVAKTIFEGYRSGDPLTPLQSEFLLEKSAGLVYFYLHSDVHLHATTDKETKQRHDAYASASTPRWLSGSGLTEDDKRIMFTEREQQTIDLIQSFLESQPDNNEPVALIYGGAHQFDEVTTTKFNPQIYRKTYHSDTLFRNVSINLCTEVPCEKSPEITEKAHTSKQSHENNFSDAPENRTDTALSISPGIPASSSEIDQSPFGNKNLTPEEAFLLFYRVLTAFHRSESPSDLNQTSSSSISVD